MVIVDILPLFLYGAIDMDIFPSQKEIVWWSQTLKDIVDCY